MVGVICYNFINYKSTCVFSTFQLFHYIRQKSSNHYNNMFSHILRCPMLSLCTGALFSFFSGDKDIMKMKVLLMMMKFFFSWGGDIFLRDYVDDELLNNLLVCVLCVCVCFFIFVNQHTKKKT